MELKDSKTVIDPDTGLPKLPEGYFWEVEVIDDGTGLYIQLLEEGTRWKETKRRGLFRKVEKELVDDHDRIDYTYLWLNDDYIEDGTILDDAYVQSKLVEATSKLIGKLQEQWDLKALLTKYSGKYPPKSINQL